MHACCRLGLVFGIKDMGVDPSSVPVCPIPWINVSQVAVLLTAALSFSFIPDNPHLSSS
jgi:hypothetical protein